MTGAGLGTREKMILSFPSGSPVRLKGTMKQNEIRNGGFFWERTIYQSDAFLSLSKNAIKMLIALLDDRRKPHDWKKLKKKYPNTPDFLNLDRLKAPYVRLKERYGMNDDGIARAKSELLEKGFINITNPGGLGKRDQTLYELVDDFKIWKPGDVIRKREKDVKRGYQGKRLGATAPLKCGKFGGPLEPCEFEFGECGDCLLGIKKKIRSGNRRLTHAVKPETKKVFSIRKPESKKRAKIDANV